MTLLLHSSSPSLVPPAPRWALPADPALSAQDATVAVTGAAGFVGGWLVTYCLERGYSVRACVRDVDDDSKVGFMKAMPEYGSKLTLHAADMTVEGAYDEIFEGVHTVFHPAEVFMSAGRPTGWARNSGQEISEKMLHDNAMQTCQFMVDSINKSSTTRRLIYTASIASMMPTVPGAYIDNPIIDEDREPHASHSSPHGCKRRSNSSFLLALRGNLTDKEPVHRRHDQALHGALLRLRGGPLRRQVVDDDGQPRRHRRAGPQRAPGS